MSLPFESRLVLQVFGLWLPRRLHRLRRLQSTHIRRRVVEDMFGGCAFQGQVVVDAVVVVVDDVVIVVTVIVIIVAADVTHVAFLFEHIDETSPAENEAGK